MKSIKLAFCDTRSHYEYDGFDLFLRGVWYTLNRKKPFIYSIIYIKCLLNHRYDLKLKYSIRNKNNEVRNSQEIPRHIRKEGCLYKYCQKERNSIYLQVHSNQDIREIRRIVDSLERFRKWKEQELSLKIN